MAKKNAKPETPESENNESIPETEVVAAKNVRNGVMVFEEGQHPRSLRAEREHPVKKAPKDGVADTRAK